MRRRKIPPRFAAYIGSSLAATVALLLLEQSTPADARHESACSARHGTALAANEQARVFRVGDADDYVAFGCAYRRGRIRRLGDFADVSGGGAFGFRLAGRFVAYAYHFCDRVEKTCDPRNSVRVMNLRTRRVRRSGRTPEGAADATDIELKDNGSVAWTRQIGDVGRIIEVRKLDVDGESVLDSGPDIDPGSLALSDSTLYWTKGGVPWTAHLK